METDVDTYFAQHDIPSVVSDMLFELGFHRPKDVGRFMSAFVDRRFRLEGAEKKGGAAASGVTDVPVEEDFSTIEVRATTPEVGSDAALAASLLEEVRALRRKYREHQPRAVPGVEASEGEASVAAIAWSEFRGDYERALAIFTNPQLWAFCEKRLAQLRCLYEVHLSLNSEAEEAEMSSAPPPARVDNCIQLARALAPCRLMDLYRRLAESDSAKTSDVLPGRTLADLASQLGRPPGPTDLTCDADSVPSASTLCGVFSRISNHAKGQFLAEAARASFSILEATEEASGGAAYAEYRLPLFPESGSWADVARWAEDFKVRSARARWVAQLPQGAYSGLKEHRSVLNFGELLGNVFGPLVAAAQVPESPTEKATSRQLPQLLEDVCAVEVAACPRGAEELGQAVDEEPAKWEAAQSPPFAYQLYHVWASLESLNAKREAARLAALPLRCASASAEPLVGAYLLGATGVSRCGALPAHAPLQYLFALDEVDVAVSLTSRRSLGSAGAAGTQAFAQLFKAGVRVALCTEDPTVSQQCDHALGLEYSLARSSLGLSQADMAEIALNSATRASFPELKAPESPQRTDGVAVEAAGPPKSIRERYRRGRRDAELALLARLAPQASMGPH